MEGEGMTTLKSSVGRNTRGNNRPVASVETLPCPSGGLHVLTNHTERDRLVTYCVGCGVTWQALDAEVRANVPAKATHCECGKRLVTRHVWDKASREERQGAAVRYGNECSKCYDRTRYVS